MSKTDGFSSIGQWAVAAKRALDGGEVDPRLSTSPEYLSTILQAYLLGMEAPDRVEFLASLKFCPSCGADIAEAGCECRRTDR